MVFKKNKLYNNSTLDYIDFTSGLDDAYQF